jgi:hypothetical protein
MFIFQKTEVQTVVLKCLTGLNLGKLNLEWFKRYGLRFSLWLHASLAEIQKNSK